MDSFIESCELARVSMFSFFRKKSPAPGTATPVSAPATEPPARTPESGSLIGSTLGRALEVPAQAPAAPERQTWLRKLREGLRKTGSGLSQVFTGGQIDDALYEELETALLMADAGVQATDWLLKEVKRKVAATGATRPVQVQNILADVLTQLLQPLQKPLVIGQHTPTVIMVAGVNGAGKTTSIGKLTHHLASRRATKCCWRRPTPSARRRASSSRSGETATAWTS